MSAVEATPQIAAQPSQDQPRSRRPRRPRQDQRAGVSQADGTPQSQPQSRRGGGGGGGGGRGRGARDSLMALRPSSVAPSSHTPSREPSSAEVSSTEQSTTTRGNRAGGRGRGGRRQEQRTVNGRRFGGNLTSQDTQLDLAGDAPTFVPGQPLVHRTEDQRPLQRHPRARRASKSTAPDIATRTHEDIEHGHYECPICTSEVLRNSKVWSCHTCWTVFHLSCVKKWSTNEGSKAAQQQSMQNGDIPPPRQWRCPGCNLPKDTLPKMYTCWCEKELDPKAAVGIPPHSCGNTCGKERVRKCPHPCQLTCHAGPCPPCTHMGPVQSCFCGKHENTRKCVDTDYSSGWSCGDICGDLMPCGEHSCSRPCHEGLCGACEERVDARCYCGQVEKEILCCDRGEEQTSELVHQSSTDDNPLEEWTGIFECANTCSRAYDCGHHHCEKSCHPQDAQPAHCPRSPDVVSHCPCGKTELSDISEIARETCQDTIPNCDKKCNKQLPCGHACEQICHSGGCRPCLQSVQINCRCGRTTSKTICHQGVEEAPQCMRMCRVTLSCGRHACDERCCPGERKAGERQTTKRKQRPIDSAPRPVDEGFEAEHICTRMCGRPLKCGNHVCEELCHKGPCGSCREAIFEEISCDCGRTVLDPPLPCGTQPPPCRFQCERPKACGHPQVAHTCHLNNENCPKCPFLVERRCMCAKKVMKNQQCWLQDVRCGQICGAKLKCGSHFCRKTCHRPGDCEDADGQACQQPCGKPKKICEHPDENICHAPYPCKEEKPCTSKIFITCQCQAQKQEAKCGASRASEGNLNKTLPCNDECARLERNRKLAVALNIDQESHVEGGDHIPFSEETLTLYPQFPKWGQQQEREFRVFAASEDEKRLRFKPMPANQRAFLHSLAEDFGLDSESMDPEPHRHVAIFKTPRFVSSPNKTVGDCVRIRNSQRAVVVKATQARANEVGEPFNAFVISTPRFGLTIDEVRAETVATVPASTPVQFDIKFLPSEDVILKASSQGLPDADLEQILKNIKPALATAISAKALGILRLCRTDASLNISRRELDVGTTDGWSRVAAKSAAPRRLIPQSTPGANNSFAALSGNKMTFARKKEEPKKVKAVKKEPVPEVADDWEAAEQEEEDKEAKGTQVAEVNDSAPEEDTIAVETTGTLSERENSVPAAMEDTIAIIEHAPTESVLAETGSSVPATIEDSTVTTEHTSTESVVPELESSDPAATIDNTTIEGEVAQDTTEQSNEES